MMDKTRLLAVIAVGVLGSSVLGDTIFVDDDTCPNTGDGSIGNPYCSIQTAIDAAVNGDEVRRSRHLALSTRLRLLWIWAVVAAPSRRPS